jgi:hypothetical protein
MTARKNQAPPVVFKASILKAVLRAGELSDMTRSDMTTALMNQRPRIDLANGNALLSSHEQSGS